MSGVFLEELKRTVLLRLDDLEVRFLLAEVLFGEGDRRGATKQVEKILAIAPEHRNAVRLLARAHEKSGRPDEAARTLEGLVRRLGDDVGPRDELVELLLAAGRIDDALLQCE